MEYSFLGLVIFFGSGLSFLMAISQIVMRDPKPGNRILAGVYLTLSLLLFEHFAVGYARAPEDIFTNPVLGLIFIEIRLMKYLIGPLLFLYIRSLMTGEPSLRKRDMLHFLPYWACCIAAVAGVLDLLYLKYFDLHVYAVILEWALSVCYFHIMLYVVGAFKMIHFTNIHLPADMAGAVKISLYLAVCAVLILLPLLTFIFYKSQALEKAGLVLVTAWVVSLFILGNRYPEFIHHVAREAKRSRYERSLIKGLDAELLRARLIELMAEEKLFCDEDISLDRLAGHLSITRHQLSEFLNNTLKTNFSSFINQYRVEEAKKLMAQQPERSILSTAFAVGFNSKSVFYSSFTRQTGKTPVKYREEVLADRSTFS